MFAMKKMQAVMKESIAKMSHVTLLPRALYIAGPTTVPVMLPQALKRAKRAEAFSLAPGRGPISSLTAYTSSDKIGTTTDPDDIPMMMRPNINIMIYIRPTP